MNYEKRYNELIDAIKEMMEANPHDEGLQNWVHDNVPELTESEEMNRKEIDLMRLYNRVLNTFGVVNQTFMLVEECAELLNAVAKMKRGRAKKEDIITELADVSIMVEQLAFFYGWDDYKNEKERKLTRIEDKINHHTKKGGEE